MEKIISHVFHIVQHVSQVI